MYDTIESVLESGLALGKIKVLLETLFEMDKDEIEAAIEEAGIKKTRSGGFAGEFYAFLAEEPRTDDEVEAYILDVNNSGNTHKHLSHFKAIAAMSITIWNKKETEVAEAA